MEVPCGKCVICQRNLVHDWGFRLRYEAEASKKVYFVRLSYDNEHLPINKDGYVTLVKSDLQKFFKRLRKKISFRYFAVGEYGSKFGRPHYHVLFFINDIIEWKQFRDIVYDCWYHQNIHVQTARDLVRLAHYTGKYCFKNDNRVHESQLKPYRTCSKKPILGYAYIQKFGDFHLINSKYRYLSTESKPNKPSRLPLAFQRKIFKNETEIQKHGRLLANQLNKTDYEVKQYLKNHRSSEECNINDIRVRIRNQRISYSEIEERRNKEQLNNKDEDL